MTEEGTESDGRRFHLIELVGSGAFGEVYLAEQDSGAGFRRKVAIKLLNEDMRSMREAGRRMRDEARILGRLAHRNIVTVLDLVQLGERWAIIMDYVPGADIEQVIQTLERLGEPFPVPAALEAIAMVLSALDAATHTEDGAGGELAVIHRDIKPSNVRLTPDGEVKVLDFGVARFSLDTREAATRANGWIGTERYMSPERILCEGDSAAGDVYAATATLVEMVLQRPLGRTPVLAERHEPFVEESLQAIALLIEADEGVRDRVVDAIRTGLATAPGDRPDARALAAELESLAREIRGEALGPFSRRVVRRVNDVLGKQAEPATGVLRERSSAVISNTSSVTLAVPETPSPAETRWVSDEAPTTASPWTTRRLVAVFVALAMLFGVTGLVGAVALVATQSGLGRPTVGAGQVTDSDPDQVPLATTDPTPLPVAPVSPVVAPTPSVAPEAGAPAGSADLAAPVAAPPAPAVRPRPADPAPAPAPSTEVAIDAVRLSRAQFNLRDASNLDVRCGDRHASGTASVRLTDFPAGSCSIEADWLGTHYRSEIEVDRPRAVNCSVAGGALTCL